MTKVLLVEDDRSILLGLEKNLRFEHVGFAYDAAANIGLGFGASTGASAKQVDALLAEADKAKARFTLRVAVPLNASAATVVRSIDAFRKK